MSAMITPNPFDEIIERLARIERVCSVLEEKTNQTANSPPVEEPIDIQEASAVIKKKVPTIYGHVHRCEIPHYKKSGKLYFLRSELIAWMLSGKKKTGKEIEQLAAKTLER